MDIRVHTKKTLPFFSLVYVVIPFCTCDLSDTWDDPVSGNKTHKKVRG